MLPLRVVSFRNGFYTVALMDDISPMPADTLLVIQSPREMPSFQVFVGSPKIRSMVVILKYLHVASMEDGYIWLADCLQILPPRPLELGGQSDN